jgi:hypothetical protein
MSKVDELFADYVREHRATSAIDAAAYLERVEGVERRELAALIDGYLARRPRRKFDPAEFVGSPSDAVAQALDRSLHGRSGMWPVVLPQLRGQAQLSREDLVPHLASALGVSNAQEKVGRYYDEMERGQLSAGDVSDRVLAALADIVGSNANTLRVAGQAVAPPEPSRSAPDVPSIGATGVESSWDQVDELFRGGRGD